MSVSAYLKPGWLNRQFHENSIEIATWPKSLRDNMRSTYSDDSLTVEQRKEAARRLRERANELDPQGESL